jgi:hypothetical protein
MWALWRVLVRREFFRQYGRNTEGRQLLLTDIAVDDGPHNSDGLLLRQSVESFRPNIGEAQRSIANALSWMFCCPISLKVARCSI